MELSEDEKEAQKLIVAEIFKTMDLLENHLQKYCDEVAILYTGAKSTMVPMEYIKTSIKTIKEGFQKGVDRQDKQ